MAPFSPRLAAASRTRRMSYACCAAGRCCSTCMAGRTVSCVAVCRASVAAGAVSLAFVETSLCVLARASTAFLTALRCWDLLMSSLMFSPASCVSVLMAVGLFKMSMAVLLVTRPFWVTSSAARSSRSPLPSSASMACTLAWYSRPISALVRVCPASSFCWSCTASL